MRLITENKVTGKQAKVGAHQSSCGCNAITFVTEMELNRKGRTVSAFSISGFGVRKGVALLTIAEESSIMD